MRELAVSEWAKRLGGLSGEQIKRGLDDWNDKWPPNVETFRASCLGRDNPHGSAAYKFFPKALPKPKSDAARAAAELAKMRDCLRSARKAPVGPRRASQAQDYAASLLSADGEASAIEKIQKAREAK